MTEIRSAKELKKRFPQVTVEEDCRINVDDLYFIGKAILRDNVRLSGHRMIFGENAYLNHHAEIGGGSCEEGSFFCGKNFHLGSYSMINIAREVVVGDNVGIGMFSLLTTHGAYLDVTQGFPETWGSIQIGSNVWLPKVTVLPNVTIGSNVVVAADSLVNHDLRSGCLYAGIPAKIIKLDCYPKPMTPEDRAKYVSQFKGDRNKLRRHGIRD